MLKPRKRDTRPSIPCPFCGHDKTYVINSRGVASNPVIRRRRICYNCNDADPNTGKFTTYERIEIVSSMVVIKNDGKREPFKREKLERSLKLAFTKRNLSAERLDRVINSIISALDVHSQKESTKVHASKTPTRDQYITVPSKRIGAMCLSSLKDLDHIAYTRYASIFFKFHSLDNYQTLIDSLSNHGDDDLTVAT